jgi:hypothetical protein
MMDAMNTGISAEKFYEDMLSRDRWAPSSRGALEFEARDVEIAVEGWLLPEEERPRCAVAGCGREPKFWKKSGRPVMDGQWVCSKACAVEMMQAVVRKQMVHGAYSDGTAHRHRIPLGLVLLDQGAITQAQLRAALEAQRAAGRGRIGEWLDATCGVASEAIVRALAVQWNRPVLSSLGFQAERMGLVMPEALRSELRVVPLRVAAGKILYVAFEERIDAGVVAMLERMTGLRVESGLLDVASFAAAERGFAATRPVACVARTVVDAEDMSEQCVRALFEYQPIASRLVSVYGHWWMRLWLERGAVSAVGTLPSTGEDVVDVLLRS